MKVEKIVHMHSYAFEQLHKRQTATGIKQRNASHNANCKFSKIRDKLDIYHFNSNCNFFCIAFQSEKIQAHPFQKHSSTRGTVFNCIFQNQLFYPKDKILTLTKNSLNFWHPERDKWHRCNHFLSFLVCIKVLQVPFYQAIKIFKSKVKRRK